MTLSDAPQRQLLEIVGRRGWETDPHALEPHLTEWRGVLRGRTPVMLSPDNALQVASIVKVCSVNGIGIVPQGGNTGMCGGAVPDDSGTQILLSLSRLNRIRSVDPDDFSLVAECGCVLADIQDAARESRRLFPLSHGGEGSAQIGGNLSTNAGGINVLRYGTARNLVLGLEVVLADGRIWNGLRTLRKDTAGYDLKQLFIGSEGTLGIITAAALKLLPEPGATRTALLAIDDVVAAVELLALCREQLADQIQAFELIGRTAMECVLQHIADSRLPLSEDSRWYVLLEAAEAAGTPLEDTLAIAIKKGLASDAVIAKNSAESEQLWRLRHSISEAEKRSGAGVKHDVAVPIGRIEAFISEADKRLGRHAPEIRPVVFGHVGDGNLHFNALLPDGLASDAEQYMRETVSGIVYDLVAEMGGSISAEHGIGVLKKQYLEHYKEAVELDLMRTMKTALDPGNILNPGKVI